MQQAQLLHANIFMLKRDSSLLPYVRSQQAALRLGCHAYQLDVICDISM
jgi:hypothetical protein